MSIETLRARFGQGSSGARSLDDRRAVIDIGSNTVRLVIYGGPARAPEVLWNEKVSARLGRDLAKSGDMPASAMNEALAALARYALIVRDLKIADVDTVATAAPRDAANGEAFIAQVAALGLPVRILSGEEEACASAWGAIGAFPEARGIVADLGGGSLELVSVADGQCGQGKTFPLGTLRLPALRSENRLERKVGKLLQNVANDFTDRRGYPLYMVGGTWRALATCAMRWMDHPLTDPHGFTIDAEAASLVANRVAQSKSPQLAQLRGVSAMRADKLPDAAALLLALLRHLEPERLVFSSWGLREGLHFSRLEPGQQSSDPLLAGVAAFCGERYAAASHASLAVAWTGAAARGGGKRTKNLRLAAAQLATALHRVEPNLRQARALEWALDKRWVGIDFAGRAMLAAALRGSLGATEPHGRMITLASPGELREATAWGLAFRLAQRLGAGSDLALASSQLAVQGGRLVLALDAGHAALVTAGVRKDLSALAGWLGLEAQLAV